MEITPKEVIQAALREKGLNQSSLAARLGRERGAISRTLSRSPVDQRSDWPAILDALGLEIVIRPKGEK